MINKLNLFLHFIIFSLSKKNISMLFDKHKVILIDTPLHGNLGDQAIALAEQKVLRRIHDNSTIYEISNTELKYCLFNILIAARKSDYIYVHGGGFIGSLWKQEHNTFIKCLNVLKRKKITVFPQTIYFYDNEKQLKEEFFNTVNRCNDLTICVRDISSYNLLKEREIQCNVICTPDIVLSLKRKTEEIYEGNGKVLLCFRNDLEKVSCTKNIEDMLKDNGYYIDFTDTVVSQNIRENEREQSVYDKIEEFSHYDLVICDRLHAMIFSVIAGTPCIAIDNVSKKVSGVYQWISDLDYVKCLEIDEIDIMLIKKMIEKGHHDYDPSFLEEKFMPIFVKE